MRFGAAEAEGDAIGRVIVLFLGNRPRFDRFPFEGTKNGKENENDFEVIFSE